MRFTKIQLKNILYESQAIRYYPPPERDSQILFYLKVNNNQHATFEYLQHWIDIIDSMNARFYYHL